MREIVEANKCSGNRRQKAFGGCVLEIKQHGLGALVRAYLLECVRHQDVCVRALGALRACVRFVRACVRVCVLCVLCVRAHVRECVRV